MWIYFKNVGKAQDEQKANAVQKQQNSANELTDLKREVETAKSWTRSLEADLAKAQAEKQQMKEQLEFQTKVPTCLPTKLTTSL